MENFVGVKEFDLDELFCSGFTGSDTSPEEPNTGDKKVDSAEESLKSSLTFNSSDIINEGSVLAQPIPSSTMKPKTYFPKVEGECFNLTNLDTGEQLDLLNSRVQSLLNKNLSLCENDEVERELWYAARMGNELVASDILENVTTSFTWINHGMNALHVAALNGHVRICETILDYGSQVGINSQGRYGKTPLHFACEGEHLSTIQLLVRSGADINALDESLNSPLHILAGRNNFQLLKWFLNRQPCLSLVNKDGQLALDLCSSENCRDLMMSKYADQTTSLGMKVGPKDFEIQKVIGRGSFGEVYLVEKGGRSFAMKVLNKKQITERNLTRYAITERNVLTRIQHPFIVTLHYAFQTANQLFLILEYCPGGDLSLYLKENKRFSEYAAKLYLAEIVLAIEELHTHNIIYRDLKPSNIVLDSAGHCKLTDFGLSKQGILTSSTAQSFCGSVAYLAPEILAQQGHGKAVDWYLLGVLMYELLVGMPPFYAKSNEAIFHNIQTAKLKLPAKLSRKSKDLIISLLQRNPEKRLGYNSATEVKTHPFFESVDWEGVAKKQQKMPLPRLRRHDAPENFTTAHFEYTNDPSKHIEGWSFIKG